MTNKTEPVSNKEAAGVLILFIFIVGLVVWGAMYTISLFQGRVIHLDPVPTIAIATTTIATEATECKAAGGEFTITDIVENPESCPYNDAQGLETCLHPTPTGYTLTCTIPSKVRSEVTITVQ